MADTQPAQDPAQANPSSTDVLVDFHAQPFHIAEMRQRFDEQAQSDLTSTYSDSAMAQDPANPTLIAGEIAAEVDYFKKIKFKYREQETKESFLKLILADHPEQIDQAENEAVAAENEKSKAVLRKAKGELAALKDEVLQIAKEVATDYTALSADLAEAEQLKKEVREMELELARLRATFPPSERITVDEANQLLDDQIQELQDLAETQDTLTKTVEATKRDIGRLIKEVDALEPEYLKEQARLKAKQSDKSNQPREVVQLEEFCQWYQTTLSLHQSFLSIRSITKEGPNEVHITYDLPADEMEGTTLVLVIQPSANGRQKGTLLDATLLNSDIDISQAVANAIPANDVPRLVGDVLLLLRSSA